MTLIASVAIVVLSVVLAGALLWWGVGWLGAWRLNRAPTLGPTSEFTFTPWELDVASEPVEFPAADGIRLQGWFLPRDDGQPVIVAMHGYRGEMSQVLGISSLLWRAGFNVLLFDFRGRGRSEPAPISMGAWERADLAGALAWLEARVPQSPVGLFGFSMGAVVALLEGADSRIGAIVADSAFARQRDVLAHIADADARRLFGGGVGGRRFLPAIAWWHRRWGKPPFDAVQPIDEAPRVTAPVLFVHGGRDRLVPAGQVEALAAATAGPTEVWCVEAALHCGAYFVDREAYMNRVIDFYRRHVRRPGVDGAPPGSSA